MGVREIITITLNLMNKNAVVVTNINFDSVFKYTRPFFEHYCNKTNSDLIIIRENEYDLEYDARYNKVRFNNFQVFNYFDVYDRIFLIDCDVVILPSCPTYFDLDPEYIYARLIGGQESNIIRTKESLGDIKQWDKEYFNSGILLFSKKHKPVFDINKSIFEKLKGTHRVQNLLNWQVKKNNFEVLNFNTRVNLPRHLLPANINTTNSVDMIHYVGPKQENSRNMKWLKKDYLNLKNKF